MIRDKKINVEDLFVRLKKMLSGQKGSLERYYDGSNITSMGKSKYRS